MVTLVQVLLAAAAFVLLAGEAVRGQCHRMLSTPTALRMPERATGEAAA